MKNFKSTLILVLLMTSCSNTNSIKTGYIVNSTWAFALDNVYNEVYFADSTFVIYNADYYFYSSGVYKVSGDSITVNKGKDNYTLINNIALAPLLFKGVFNNKDVTFHKIMSNSYTFDKLNMQNKISIKKFNKDFRRRAINYCRNVELVDTLNITDLIRSPDPDSKIIIDD